MKRWLFNVAASVSLVIFIAALLLWVRSFWRIDTLQNARRFHGDTFICSANTWRGALELSAERLPGDWDDPYWSFSTDPVVGDEPLYVLWSFHMEVNGDGLLGPYPGQIELYFSGWMLIFAVAVLPAIWLLLRRRILKPGLCAVCGYDLRATPDRCPECGTMPTRAGYVTLSGTTLTKER